MLPKMGADELGQKVKYIAFSAILRKVLIEFNITFSPLKCADFLY